MWKLAKRQAIIITVIMTFLLIGLGVYHQYSTDVLDEEIRQRVQLESDSINKEIIAYFNEFESMINLIEIYIEQDPSDEALLAFLTNIYDTNDDIASLYLGTPDNEMINATGFTPPEDFDLTIRPWYVEAVNNNALVYTDAFLNATEDKMIVTLSKPIYLDDELKGVLAIDLDIYTITNYVRSINIEDEGYAFIYDRKDNLLAHPSITGDTLSLKNVDTINDSLSSLEANTVLESIELDGIDGLIYLDVNPNISWRIAVFIPVSAFYYSETQMIRLMVVSTFLVIGLLGVTLFLLRQVFVKPMMDLETDINAIDTANNLGYRLEHSNKDAFKNIRDKINRNLQNTEDYFLALRKKLSELDQANASLNEAKEALNVQLDQSKKTEDSFRRLISEMNQGLASHEIIEDEHGNVIDYKFIYINDSFEKVTGLKREDIIDKTIKTVLPNTESYWINKYGRVAKTGERIHITNYSQELNKWFEVVAYSPARNRFATIVNDVTDKLDLEDKLSKENQRFSNLVNSMEDLIFELDLNGVYTAVYGKWLNKVSESSNYYIGKSIRDVFDENTAKVHEEAYQQALEKGRVLYDWEAEVDGKKVYYQNSLSTLKDSSGDTVGVIGIGRNITGRIEAEKSLEKSEKRYRLVSEVSHTGIWEYNRETDDMWCSPEYFTMLGYNETELIEKVDKVRDIWGLLLHPDDKAMATKKYEDYLENLSGMYENTFRMKHKDGSYIWIWARGQTLRDEKGNKTSVTVGTHIDVSDQIASQEEINYLGSHDYLTDIHNRRYFSEQLDKLDHSSCYPLGVMMMDLNGLKLLNDAFGHAYGDKALIAVAKVLMSLKKEKEVVARVGGDEFAMIIPNMTRNRADFIIEEVNRLLEKIEVEGIKLTLAIGYGEKTSQDEDMATVLKVAEDFMYKRKILEGQSGRNVAIQSILKTLTNKYQEEAEHSERVGKMCFKIGEALQLSEDNLEELKLAGKLHDIGKVAVPEAILNKPAALTEEEFKRVKEHTFNGYQILRAADAYTDIAEYALTHHERVDGTGYPNGLKGKEIRLFSRIISVADAYETMTSDRPYRKAMSKEKAIKELQENAGTQFDASIVDVFINKVLKQHKTI